MPIHAHESNDASQDLLAHAVETSVQTHSPGTRAMSEDEDSLRLL
jgi:hypothetical protein